VEFVANQETREPFAADKGVTASIVDAVFERNVLIMPGAPGLVDGAKGDHIAISPPFTIDEEQVDTTVRAVTEAVQETARNLGF
jgi:adenosylmethionine-8-amino-7-oxononanoate aminotransferase